MNSGDWIMTIIIGIGLGGCACCGWITTWDGWIAHAVKIIIGIAVRVLDVVLI